MRRIELGLLVIALFGLGGVNGFPAQAERPTYCESNVGSPNDLNELKHGLLQGYLDLNTLPDSLKLLAPPPEPGSAAQALDEEIAKANFSHEGTARWSQAATDADLNFPAAASIFSCSLGIEISEERTPRLYTLLRRSLTDAGLASYKAKNHYQRTRPFMSNGKSICTPDDENGSANRRLLPIRSHLCGLGLGSHPQ
jgi:acid phosphatase (class A)